MLSCLKMYITFYDCVQTISTFLIIYIICNLIQRYVNRRKYNPPPVPTVWPIVGYIGGVSHLTIWNHRDTYGPLSHISVAGADIVILNDINVIREAFLTRHDFDNRPLTFGKKYLYIDDIVFSSPSDKHWGKARRFLHTKLKVYGRGIDKIEDVIGDELKFVESMISGKNGKPFDILGILEPSLCNVIFTLLVRKRFDYDSEIIHDVSTLINPTAIPRSCTTDCTINGLTITNNSVILSNIFRILHDPDLWNEPWVFEPKRFLNDDGLILASHPTRRQLIGFGIGARTCVGEVFANTRLFLYITHLLQRFNFVCYGELPSCDPRNFPIGLTIHPESYNLVAEER